MTKRYFLQISLVLMPLLFAAPALAQQRFVANLSGAQEVPATGSTGTGACSVILNAAETQISITCAYSGLTSSVNAAHIHGSAPAGENADVLFNFNFTGGTSGTISAGPFTVTPSQVADIKAHRFYINVHTNQFPNGEVRGQIKRTDVFTDVDGEGRADVHVYRPSNNTFYIQRSLDVQRGLSNVFQAQQFGQAGDFTAMGDFDGDGKADFVALRVASNGQITWFILQSGNNTLRSVLWGNVAGSSDFPAASDFDGDGKLDIAVYRRNNGVWYIIESSTNAPRYERFGLFDDQPVPGDYDKDGKDDVAVVRAENGQNVWYVQRSSDGGIRRIVWGLASDSFFELLPVDVDGDAAFDPLVYRDGADGKRTFYALRSSDNQIFALQWGLESDTPLIGDYDGDGKTDFAARREVNGRLVWYIYQSSNGQMRTVFWGISSDM